MSAQVFALRTTANREEQVMDFISANVLKRKIEVYSLVSPHGMRGYIFLEARDRQSAEASYSGVPYAKGLLSRPVEYNEIEPMLEQAQIQMNIQKNDIVEIISGPFKREKGKVARVDMQKGEAVLELLETAVPIPLTVKLDAVKVIRRDTEEDVAEEE